MLADSPKPEAYHSQPGLDKYSQHYVMLRLTTIIVMFTSITVIIFASMIIKSILKLQTMPTVVIRTALNVKLVANLCLFSIF